jgi:hypothetical protein
VFQDDAQMLSFVEQLFGLDKANGDHQLIKREMQAYIPTLRVSADREHHAPVPTQSLAQLDNDASTTCMPWGLLFASAQKPRISSASRAQQPIPLASLPGQIEARFQFNQLQASPASWMTQYFASHTFDIRSWGQLADHALWARAATSLGIDRLKDKSHHALPRQRLMCTLVRIAGLSYRAFGNDVTLLISSHSANWQQHTLPNVYCSQFVGSQQYWSNRAGVWLSVVQNSRSICMPVCSTLSALYRLQTIYIARVGSIYLASKALARFLQYSPRSYLIPTGSREGIRQAEPIVNQTNALLADIDGIIHAGHTHVHAHVLFTRPQDVRVVRINRSCVTGSVHGRLFEPQPFIDGAGTTTTHKWSVTPGFSLSDVQNIHQHHGSQGRATRMWSLISSLLTLGC